MITNDYKQIKIIHSKNADTFEEQYNATLKELAGKHIDVQTPEFNGEEFWCAVNYTESVIDESTITCKDEAHMAGEVHLCSECPFCEWTDDKRVKRIRCKYADFGHTRKDSECCERLYRMLANNEVNLIEGR